MPFIYSNNGLSRRWVDPSENYQPKPGEVALDPAQLGHEITDADITAAFPGYPAALAAQNAVATLEAQLASGCQIASTSTPSVSGTYGLDPGTRSEMTSEATYVQSTGGTQFSSGETTLVWVDQLGNPVVFPSPATFIAVVQAIARYYTALKLAIAGQGQPPSQPVNV